MPEIVSIQLGKVRHYGEGKDEWVTATFKEPVTGGVLLTGEGFAGDAVADRRYHGGPEKAVLVYSHDHYALWDAELFHQQLPPGAFGENILVAGLTENETCLGDIWEIGRALVQVSQPRQPCWKQARRWGIRDLVVRMNHAGRSGWYLRVLREGTVKAGDPFHLRERTHPEWPIARANQVYHFRKNDRSATAELAACPALAESWRVELLERLEG